MTITQNINGKAVPDYNQEDRLFDRKTAAAYLGGENSPLSAGTLAVWDCTGRYDLKPIKVGRYVRYRKSVLDKFLEDRQRHV